MGFWYDKGYNRQLFKSVKDEPRNEFSGLFIELKVETPFKKNGEIKASTNDHLKNQLESIEKLKAKGYFCCFSWGFDMTKDIIDNYLKV